MRNFLIKPVLLTLVALLAACGGGGAGTGAFNSSSQPSSGSGGITTTTTVASLLLTTSVPQIPSAGTSAATITALALDSSNNALTNVVVTFSASSGVLSSVQNSTGTTGVASAVLGTGGTPQNGTITVTATAGSAKSQVAVVVTGTTLTLSGPLSLVQGNAAGYSVTLTDSGGNGIANQVVTLKSSNGNTLPATVTTGGQGQATFSYTATSSGTDTITATTPYVSTAATQQVSVSSQNFTITAPTPNGTSPNVTLDINTSQTVSVSWQNGGVAVSSGTVQFSSSRGTITVAGGGNSTAVSSSGTASATLSSTTAGPSVVTATALDANGNVVASAQIQVNFVAPLTGSDYISIQANPAAVAVSGQSTVVATVTDGSNASGNPVQGVPVNFTLTDSTGGGLSSGTAVTNAQGQATVIYTASTVSSTPNGVRIQASVPAFSSITPATTTLTVGGQTVFLSLGTGNKIQDATTNPLTQYAMPFSVQAVDAAGNGLNNVTITFSVKSVAYAQGLMVLPSSTSTTSTWEPYYTTTPGDSAAYVLAGTPGCIPTQVYEVNGQVYPATAPNTVPSTVPSGSAPVLTAIPGSVASTDAPQAQVVTAVNGTASANLIYPKSYVDWVAVALTASTTVSGSQSSTTMTLWLPGAAADFSTSASPPNPVSPFNPYNFTVTTSSTGSTVIPQTACYLVQ